MKVVGQGGDEVEVLALIQQLVPEIVLLDLRKRRMDGLNLLKEINQSQLLTKAIVMTTFDSEEDIQNASGPLPLRRRCDAV
jgi:DNA-binding NarL/FixJ family response regulator